MYAVGTAVILITFTILITEIGNKWFELDKKETKKNRIPFGYQLSPRWNGCYDIKLYGIK